MNLSSKINVNHICTRGATTSLVQLCGNWPDNPRSGTVYGSNSDCRDFISALKDKGLTAPKIILTKRQVWTQEGVAIRKLVGDDNIDLMSMTGRLELNKIISRMLADLLTEQLAIDSAILFERFKESCDIPATLEDLLCNARQQQLKQWQADIMTEQADNKGAEAYLRSAPFPRFDGKYDSDTRNRMGGIAGAEPTITSTDNTEEQHEE